MTIKIRNVLALAGTAAIWLGTAGGARATTFDFDVNGLANTPQGPTRIVLGGEEFIPSINLATDVFAVNGPAFGFTSPAVSFANSFVANLTGGQNVIVVEDLDQGGGRKPSGNTLAAGTAANLIANSGKESGPGLFVYFNSALNVSRLVYDTNFASTTSNLEVLARFTGEVGQTGINDLPNFTAANFALQSTDVPEPASAALLLVGLTGVAVAFRKRASS